MLKNKYFKLHLEEANSFRKRNFGFIIFKRVLVTILLVVAIGFLVSCSTTPIVDSRGKSSANIKGDMKGKSFYNLMRFKVLWLSPKAKTRTDMLYNCLEGRGYNVINK